MWKGVIFSPHYFSVGFGWGRLSGSKKKLVEGNNWTVHGIGMVVMWYGLRRNETETFTQVCFGRVKIVPKGKC